MVNSKATLLVASAVVAILCVDWMGDEVWSHYYGPAANCFVGASSTDGTEDVGRGGDGDFGGRDLQQFVSWDGNLWSNRVDGKVQIPYHLTESFFEAGKSVLDVGDPATLVHALEDMAYITGVLDFVPWSGEEKDYINVIDAGGGDYACWSFPVGRVGGAQDLQLDQPACSAPGYSQPVFMRALGLHPSFKDRNKAGLSEDEITQIRLLYQCESGPRDFGDYEKELCSTDCKCWEGAYGCNGNDDACQGTLFCSDNNQCVSESAMEICSTDRRLSSDGTTRIFKEEEEADLNRKLNEPTLLLDRVMGDHPSRTQERDLAAAIGESQGLHFWTIRNTGGVIEVPVRFAPHFDGNQQHVWDSLNDINTRSGVVKFVPWTNQVSHMVVRGRNSDFGNKPQELNCVSFYSGRVYYLDAKTHVFLSETCASSKARTQYIFLNALGMIPEHQRPDRDEYIRIVQDNMDRFYRQSVDDVYDRSTQSVVSFGQFSTAVIDPDFYELPYDYNSVMHVNATYLSDNGGPTIESITPGTVFGQTTEASDLDMMQIRLMYQCRTGPRSKSEYDTDTCTMYCPCWEGMSGCNGNDYACQGDLVCRSDQCVKCPSPETPQEKLPLLSSCDGNEECQSGMCTGRFQATKKCRICARKKQICASTDDCCDGGTKRICHPDRNICVKCKKGSDGLCVSELE